MHRSMVLLVACQYVCDKRTLTGQEADGNVKRLGMPVFTFLLPLYLRVLVFRLYLN